MSVLLGIQSELEARVEQLVTEGHELLGYFDEAELWHGGRMAMLRRARLRRQDGSRFDIVESEGGFNTWPNGFYVLTNLRRVEIK
jgi:hypothetical protein